VLGQFPQLLRVRVACRLAAGCRQYKHDAGQSSWLAVQLLSYCIMLYPAGYDKPAALAESQLSENKRKSLALAELAEISHNLRLQRIRGADFKL